MNKNKELLKSLRLLASLGTKIQIFGQWYWMGHSMTLPGSTTPAVLILTSEADGSCTVRVQSLVDASSHTVCLGSRESLQDTTVKYGTDNSIKLESSSLHKFEGHVYFPGESHSLLAVFEALDAFELPLGEVWNILLTLQAYGFDIQVELSPVRGDIRLGEDPTATYEISSDKSVPASRELKLTLNHVCTQVTCTDTTCTFTVQIPTDPRSAVYFHVALDPERVEDIRGASDRVNAENTFLRRIVRYLSPSIQKQAPSTIQEPADLKSGKISVSEVKREEGASEAHTDGTEKKRLIIGVVGHDSYSLEILHQVFPSAEFQFVHYAYQSNDLEGDSVREFFQAGVFRTAEVGWLRVDHWIGLTREQLELVVRAGVSQSYLQFTMYTGAVSPVGFSQFSSRRPIDVPAKTRYIVPLHDELILCELGKPIGAMSREQLDEFHPGYIVANRAKRLITRCLC